MTYEFNVGGRKVTVTVKTAQHALGMVDTFTLQASMKDGGAAITEIMLPHYADRSIEHAAKRQARMFVRYNLANHDRTITFGWHDYCINTRVMHEVVRWPNAYRDRMNELVKLGSIKGTMKMILAAGEDWLA